MRRVLLFLSVSSVAILGALGAGAERAAVVVTPGSEQTYRIALQRFATLDAEPRPKLAEDFRRDLTRALEFSGVFESVPDAAFLEPVTTPPGRQDAPLDCPNWSQIGADGLVEGELARRPDGYEITFRVWDAGRCRRLLRRRYRQAGGDLGDTARRLADDVVEAFIGMRGVSGTEIAFVSDRGGNKEIFVMNADGSHSRAATANRSINNFPSWSRDGDSILYTSYRYRDRPLLFLSTRKGRPGRVLAGLGEERSQYRGVFGPDGRVAVVMSDGEAPDLFSARLDGGGVRRLTRNRAIDVSPAWSPDGRQIAFVSDRSGNPNLYIMNADGSGTRRLTYDGVYNTNPSWSPDGQWIAYETRVNNQFDIWLIDPSGDVNVPLVTHPRSDEGPSWAPNSRKLVFGSTRRGLSDLYVIDRDGSNLRRITGGTGNNTSPAWGPYPQ